MYLSYDCVPSCQIMGDSLIQGRHTCVSIIHGERDEKVSCAVKQRQSNRGHYTVIYLQSTKKLRSSGKQTEQGRSTEYVQSTKKKPMFCTVSQCRISWLKQSHTLMRSERKSGMKMGRNAILATTRSVSGSVQMVIRTG